MTNPFHTPGHKKQEVWNTFGVPTRYMYALADYVNYGHRPGPFLLAVMANDLRAAVEEVEGDPSNLDGLRNLPAFVQHFRDTYPPEAWGSEEKVMAWRGLLAEGR